MEGIGIIGNCMTFVMSFSDTHQQRVLCYLCFGFFVLVLCVCVCVCVWAVSDRGMRGKTRKAAAAPYLLSQSSCCS